VRTLPGIAVVPARAAEQEAPVGARGRAEEELLHPRLAVGQPVAQEREVRGEAGIGRDRMKCVSGSSAL
jgi:hypothetical protein